MIRVCIDPPDVYRDTGQDQDFSFPLQRDIWKRNDPGDRRSPSGLFPYLYTYPTWYTTLKVCYSKARAPIDFNVPMMLHYEPASFTFESTDTEHPFRCNIQYSLPEADCPRATMSPVWRHRNGMVFECSKTVEEIANEKYLASNEIQVFLCEESDPDFRMVLGVNKVTLEDGVTPLTFYMDRVWSLHTLFLFASDRTMVKLFGRLH